VIKSDAFARGSLLWKIMIRLKTKEKLQRAMVLNLLAHCKCFAKACRKNLLKLQNAQQNTLKRISN
jgi:hypothetical protein